MQSLTTRGRPPFSPSYPMSSSRGTPNKSDRVTTGRLICFSCFKFSLGASSALHRAENNYNSLVYCGGYIYLCDRNVVCQLGQGIDISYLAEEFGTVRGTVNFGKH